MPIYGYRCSHGHHFEVQQRITEPTLNQCPECGAPVTRVFYPVGIIFKGEGFYKTDSRGASSVAVPGDGDGSAKEAAKPDGKSDGKSDGKAESSKPNVPTKASSGEGGTSTPSAPAKTEEKTGT